MEIKIGIRHISREVTLETKESVETITLVPGEQIGYVELGSEEKRRVGFGVGA